MWRVISARAVLLHLTNRHHTMMIYTMNFVVFFSIVGFIRAQVLTPPYFNLAQGRRIVATSTCGEGVPEPELYCKLVGADTEKELNYNEVIIQGQFCDHCDPNNLEKRHPAEYAVDGRESRWQSPPLSRGTTYNEVNLTIDLGQEFHVAYVIMKMGNSPRPAVWALERSDDNGETFQPWQYFARTPAECEQFFGRGVKYSITADDSVICNTHYSKTVPLEDGEIVVPLVQDRPSANDFFNSTILQDWTRATKVRFRFLRVNNLLGHLMSLAHRDTSTTRRYFYSIKDISIGGRCRCHGHADTCTSVDQNDPYKLVCDCKDQTCGNNCEVCCPGYEQKKWSQSKTNRKFVCEPCNCFGHSNQCVYNETIDNLKLSLDIHGNYEGGGVCQNCQHNTEGINCNKCAHGFYKPANKQFDATDVCSKCQCDFFYSTGNCEDNTGRCECKPEYTKPNCDTCSYGHYGYPFCRPCDCLVNGTTNLQCEIKGGQCPCKVNYGGQYCRFCAEGYYNYPECKPCACTSVGSISNVCDTNSGECKCKNSFGGKNCDQCSDGYYSFPYCSYCSCDVKGTLPEICDKNNGQCLCKPGYGGSRCDQCTASYTGFPDCKSCNCSSVGSASAVCDITGKCTCLPNFGGKQCDQCSPGHFLYPNCTACNCDPAGTYGVTCNDDGTCICKSNFYGEKCNECKKGYYNYPVCEECNYNPAGVISTFRGCSAIKPGGLFLGIECKEHVQGKQCNDCKERYWNLQSWNPVGCEDCSCNANGTIDGITSCDSKSGQCVCKTSVTTRQCSQCINGFYNLTGDNFFGCTDCDCDVGGSVNNDCNKISGQCDCKPKVTGRNCKEPLNTHYFPTLYQYQIEVEDGTTLPSSTPVRYGFEDKIFPEYSWKGYAIFSHLQNETMHEVVISNPSVYRMILRYMNPNPIAVSGTISVIPEYANNVDVEQKFLVLFKPTSVPTFVTVAGILGNNPSPVVLNPGPWIVKIKIEKSLFLDYFVLLPADYYEASLLVSNVTNPCTIDTSEVCRHYLYPNVSSFDHVRGAGGYINNGNSRSTIQDYFNDYPGQRIPIITTLQPSLNLDMRITRPGNYSFVLIYGTVKDQSSTIIQIDIRTQNTGNKGVANIYNCRYTSLCRQVVLDRNGQVAVYPLDSNFISLILTGAGNGVGIESVIAIPAEEWSLGYIQPKSACLMKDNVCTPSTYATPPDSKKIDFKSENEDRVAKILPSTILDNTTELVLLSSGNSMIDLKGKVPKPGPYIFVLHYYQPDFPAFDIDILIQNGVFYEAKLPVQHCPSNTGCRAVVKQSTANTVFTLPENFVFSVKGLKDKSIWLHYLLVIPSAEYNEQIISELPYDQTAMFISQCGADNFHLNTSEDGFCKDATFSLTTKYNHGALPCTCNFEGSLSFECNKFGGQCPCRPNVIGRTCDTCKTKYFGFPNCQPCNCPKMALCDPYSGECICPTNVIGERCDQCMPYTYGLDQVHGCFECSCHYQGVKDSNLQCDLQTGACNCKENVEGRTCDHCVAGHWQFPWCTDCGCDLRGTTADVCNQMTNECFCKANVHGQACDVCNDGTFNLQPDNEDGCTKCFCFEKTTRCSSSALFVSSISVNDNWALATINATKSVEVTGLPTTVDKISGGIEVNLGFVLSGGVSYFVAPEQYLGNKLASYGSNLNYTLHYAASPGGQDVGGADVILYGANMYLLFESVDVPTSDAYFPMSVKIVESNFFTPWSSTVSRVELMQVLQNLTAVYIKATYSDRSEITKLLSVNLEVGVPQYSPSASVALSVEQCHCPPNYVGLSCEECADGYYRAPTGPFGGYCVPCQCNGHAATCDKMTGVCIDCKHNTKGERCDKCDVGYYGNATNGAPSDCLICACPLPMPSNNFATGCEISDQEDKIYCTCLPGYAGNRCERCADGFYGRPEVPGEVCKPCQCNGNIDPSIPGSCDHVTGRCLGCLNNTYGDSCERCKPGFFGDAVKTKKCEPCDCDSCGIRECDHQTGRCTCLTSVVGEKCDRCADNHFGFTSCQGCLPCNCDVASESQQCDDLTGHCRCKGGVTGQICDRCSPGYWKYTADGCTSCGCNTEYSVGVGCNVNTGLCECLPGVVGDKCNQCPHRWILIPDDGCFSCDKCIDGLLDVTDVLQNDFLPVFNQFQTTSIGYFTVQRLKFINDTANKYALNISDILSHQFDLTPFSHNISQVQDEAEGIRKSISIIYDDVLAAAKTGDLTHQMTKELDQLIEQVTQGVSQTVSEINLLGYSLETGAVRQVDYAVKEAQKILNDINYIDFDEEKRVTIAEALDKAKNSSGSVKVFIQPVNETTGKLDHLRKQKESLDDKLDELEEYSEKARKEAVEATGLNQLQKKAQINEKVEKLGNNTIEAENAVRILLPDITKNTSALLEIAKQDLDTLANRKQALMEGQKKTNQNVTTLQNELEAARVETRNAERHAEELQRQAYILKSAAKSPVEAYKAEDAANAYKKIATALEYALENATKAKEDAELALQKSEGLNDKIQFTQSSSMSTKSNAEKALAEVQIDLTAELKAAVQNLNSLSKNINQTNVDPINKQLKNIENLASSSDKLQKLNSDQVVQNSKQIVDDIKEIIENLPAKQEKSRILKEDLQKKRKSAQDTGSYLDQVVEALPEIQTKIDALKEKPVKVNESLENVTDKLEFLKQQVLRARDIASKINIGVKLSAKTSLELPLPASLLDQGSSTDISFYFKTNQQNALLFYLGNQAQARKRRRETHSIRKQKSDDFMALLLVNGYPQLKLDLGDKPISTLAINNPVISNRWHNAIISRTGKVINFTVVDYTGKHFWAKGECPGRNSVLNLDKDYSKFFMGGLPDTFDVPPAIEYTAFRGEFQDLAVNGEPVGFWNFVDISLPVDVPLKLGIDGSESRNELRDRAQPSSSRFSGDGYVKLPTDGYLDGSADMNTIRMNFKSTSSAGLLFLVLKGDKFMALEMTGGYIYFRYNLGKGMRLLRSVESYNDGEWHTIQANRIANQASLMVDKSSVSDNSSKEDVTFELPEYLYIAGFDGEHKLSDVTKTSFEGCLDDIQIGSKSVTISNTNSYKALSGCSDKSSKFIAFEDGAHGYVVWSIPEDSKWCTPYNMELSLRIKTTAKSGLISYGTDNQNTYNLQLTNGSLAFKSGGQTVRSSPNMKYNDGRWHSILAIQEPNALHLIIDDFEMLKSAGPPVGTNFSSSGKAYFGTVPANVDATAAYDKPFGGCIGDVTFNGVIINFEKVVEAKSVIIGQCAGLAKDIESKADQNKKDEVAISPMAPLSTPAPPVTVAPGSLPLVPAADPDLTEESGIRFGTTKTSSLMYDFDQTQFGGEISLSLDVKTIKADGIIFYVGQSADSSDFVSLYLRESNLHLKYMCDSQKDMLSIPMYNQAEWHTVKFKINSKGAELKINGNEKKGTVGCGLISISSPYYVGGFGDSNLLQTVQGKLEGMNKTFVGCLKNFKPSGRFAKDPRRLGVTGCSSKVEEGTFFSAGSYIKTYENFKVGKIIDIKMEIKPRDLSGLLIAVHSKKDFLVLQMVNGSIKFTVDNGNGPVSTTYTPQSPHYFLDNRFHAIAAYKSKNVIILTVDGNQNAPMFDYGSSLTTDTNHPLYIGGYPLSLASSRGIEFSSTSQYVGCIRLVEINGRVEDLASFTPYGNIMFNICPTI